MKKINPCGSAADSGGVIRRCKKTVTVTCHSHSHTVTRKASEGRAKLIRGKIFAAKAAKAVVHEICGGLIDCGLKWEYKQIGQENIAQCRAIWPSACSLSKKSGALRKCDNKKCTIAMIIF